VTGQQRRAFEAVVETTSGAKSIANEIPAVEEKLQTIEAMVDKLSKSKR
jgi:hypothetical protein